MLTGSIYVRTTSTVSNKSTIRTLNSFPPVVKNLMSQLVRPIEKDGEETEIQLNIIALIWLLQLFVERNNGALLSA